MMRFIPCLRKILIARIGASMVELALMLPVLVSVIGGVMQFGLVLFVQNTMLDVARDASRRVAVGALSGDAANSWIAGRLPSWVSGAKIEIVPATEINPQVFVRLSVAMKQAAIIDPLNLFGGRTLETTAIGTAR